jgi:hypothetical protein
MGSFRYSVVLERDVAEHLFVATVPALSIGTYWVVMDFRPLADPDSSGLGEAEGLGVTLLSN